jgi:hypothetical protein
MTMLLVMLQLVRPVVPMKMLLVISVLAGMAGSLRAQDLHAPDAGRAFVVHPYLKDLDLATSRFWTPATAALVTLDGAAKAADSFATRENLDGGGMEYDPLARPFVHTPPVQVAATAALFGAEIVAAYLLHKRHHDNLGHAVLVAGAAMNGLGAASSFKHRVPR